MPTWNRSGTVSKESLSTGEWTELYAVVSGTILRLGSVKDGKLNIRRKFLVHRGMAKFGTVPDRTDCVDTRMTFEGRLSEIHRENVLLLLNRPPDEAKVPAAGADPMGRIGIPNPRYPMQFFTLYGRRPYAETGEDLVFVVWKCRMADFVRLAMMRDGMRFKAVALSDKDGDYGGSASSPYGWVLGYDSTVAPPAVVCPPTEPDYWTFDGAGDYLKLPGADPSAVDFHPALNSGDFTAVGVIRPATLHVGTWYRGLLTRTTGVIGPGANRCWGLLCKGASVCSGIGTGAVGNVWNEWVCGTMTAGTKHFVAGVYEYDANPANRWMRTWLDGLKCEALFTGPAFSGSDTDVVMGWNMGDGMRMEYFHGDVYWLAYYDRALADAEVDALRLGTTTPCDVPGLFMYINFSEAVGATYTPERCLGPNAPYVFDVMGNPTKGP